MMTLNDQAGVKKVGICLKKLLKIMNIMENDSIEYYELLENVNEGSIILDDAFNQRLPERVRIESNLAVWAVIDGVLLVFILSGNILTILAVRFSRRLRSVISNMFVLSLAISDMVVGFTLPYHLAFYMGSALGQSHGWCLLRFFLIILACCVSIWNLIAIAVDRYIAIVYPLHYSRYMTKQVALILLGFGWLVGATFALIPMFWNNWETATQCEFDEILPPWYMAGVITPGFSMVWICMLIVYWRIWREASKHAKQLRSSFTGLHETPSDWKSIQVVLFILGCFSICWLPYFIIACAQIFKFLEKSSPVLYKGAFSLAMANSGMNPIIYAWKNTSFRRAFSRLLRCKSPDFVDASQHSTRSNIHRKSSSLHPQDTLNATITCTPPPNSATTGNFNIFDEGVRAEDEVRNYSRRVSLALTHSSPLSPAVTGASSAVVLVNGDVAKKLTSETKVISDRNALSFNTATTNGLVNGVKGKNLLIQQIECDGNGNTQIRLVNGTKNGLKQHQSCNDKMNELIAKLNMNNTHSDKRGLQGKPVILEQFPNGNHIINALNKYSSQIV